MTNKDIIKQYVDTGIKIPEYQFNKLGLNLLNTYLRKRIIAAKTDADSGSQINITAYEYNKLSDEQLEDVCPYINYQKIFRINIENSDSEKSDKLVSLIVKKDYDTKVLDWLYEPDNIKLFIDHSEPENKIKYICNIIDCMAKLHNAFKNYDYFKYELVPIFNSIDGENVEIVIEYLCEIMTKLRKNPYNPEEYKQREKLAIYLIGRLRFVPGYNKSLDNKIYTSLEIDDK
jgi:hypothetical protein